MEEQSCVLLENGRRISAFASQLPFMRGTALTPDPGIKNRQAPCGACRFLSKGTTFHTLRREQKSRKHNMRCLFPLFFA